MNRDFIASIIIALGCFVFFLLAVPQYDGILSAREVIKQQRDFTGQRALASDNVKDLIKQYQARKADIDKLALLLPNRDRVDEIIINLQTAAVGNGVQIRELTAGGDATSVENPKKVSLKLELTSTYPSFLNFLKEIEASLRLYDVNEISIGKDTTPGAPANSYGIEIKFNTYNLK